MLIPKIEFCHSWVYDDHWRTFYSDSKGYPTGEEVEKNLFDIENEWRRNSEDILSEMVKVTGLTWKDDTILCYVVGRCIPFSYPLTIMAYKDYPIDYVVDVLTHELVHQLFIQNDTQMKNIWKYFHEKYEEESFNTIIHIPVHAIHYHIFMKYFDKKRLKREIDIMKDMPEYIRSWDIVMEEGAENIMRGFKAKK